MPAEYSYFDDAAGTVASPGRAPAGGSLPLADASKFPAGAWAKPARLVVRRSGSLVTVLKGTGRSGSSLAVDGPLDGYADATVAPGDEVMVSWTKADVAEIHDAIDAIDVGGGEPGPKGDAATIAVGTVTTGDPGTPAVVANVGTTSAAVLNFTIPAGTPGTDGAPGGDGSPGAPGAAATVAIGTVTTLSPGASATATNVGTSAAAIIDLGIPQGATGATGAAGPNTISGLIALPADGSIAFESGTGVPGDPYKLRTRELIRIGVWGTPTDAAPASGLMARAISLPVAVTPAYVLIAAETNPAGATGGANIQVKVGGVNLFSAAVAYAANTTTALIVSTGFNVSTIAAGTKIQPELTDSLGAAIRDLKVSVYGRVV